MYGNDNLVYRCQDETEEEDLSELIDKELGEEEDSDEDDLLEDEEESEDEEETAE